MDHHCNDEGAKRLRMIEFFSGIGGMRLAVEKALQTLTLSYETSDDGRNTEYRLEIVAAYDISLQANDTYAHNFHGDSVTTKLVEQLKPQDVDDRADLWTMSPPCQPFTNTRGAKRLDADDKRCDGLKGIIRLLASIEKKPKYILLENVKGFAESSMRKSWVQCLEENGYSYKEVLLSPIQLGIPNHRQRYFVACERSCRFSKPLLDVGLLSRCGHGRNGFHQDRVEDQQVSKFLQTTLTPNELETFIVPQSVLEQHWAKDLGICTPSATATYCFTAGYGRVYHKSTGSLLLMLPSDEYGNNVDLTDRTDMLKYVGRLRRFTPVELLAVFGFPSNFDFPGHLTLDHKYKLIGNSVSVTVVTQVVSELLSSLS